MALTIEIEIFGNVIYTVMQFGLKYLKNENYMHAFSEIDWLVCHTLVAFSKYAAPVLKVF